MTSHILSTVDPNLVQAAQFYVWNQLHGKSLREIAAKSGCHASTIMRQVHKIGKNLSDPEITKLITEIAQSRPVLGNSVEHDINRAQKLLVQTDTFLALANDMDRAVIFGVLTDGAFHQLDSISAQAAHVLIIRGDLRVTSRGRVVRYTHVAQTQDAGWRADVVQHSGAILPARGDAPLVFLGRKRDSDGVPFLSRDLVQAGLRLNEDFVLSGCDAEITKNLPSILVGTYKFSTKNDALKSFLGAIAELGPGLADIAIRSCCLNEGLERSEIAMGWSARSGKIVLRIALQRLKRHYKQTHGAGGGLIG